MYKRISHVWLISPFICPFFFPTIFFHLISSESISATVFKFCIHNEDNQVYYCKQRFNSAFFFFCFPLFVHFSFSLTNFLLQISQLLFEPLNFVYNMRTTKCITENKTKVLRFILPSFSIFSFFNLSLQGNAYGNFRLQNYLT